MPGTMIDFRANGRTATGYLARPTAPHGHGVLVVQEYWGLVDHIKDVADRFAAEGFVALAPDLYHGEKAKSPDDAGKLMMALNIAETAKELGGAADALIGRDDVTPKQVGIVGFCMGGQLALIPAAMKLADEILAGPSFEETPEGVLAEEARVVANAKKMFLQAAGGAVQKFREKLADEQELIAALANIVMEIYAMESCLLRAQKAAAGKGQSATQTMIDAARVFIAEAAERVEHEARRAVTAVSEGDMLTTQMAVLKRFGKRAPVDTIALRRGVAAAIQAQDRYPFEGR